MTNNWGQKKWHSTPVEQVFSGDTACVKPQHDIACYRMLEHPLHNFSEFFYKTAAIRGCLKILRGVQNDDQFRYGKQYPGRCN